MGWCYWEEGMAREEQEHQIAAIRKLLVAAFTPEELRRFCQDRRLFRPIVDRFGSNQGLDRMVDEVITYCEKRSLFDQLLDEVRCYNSAQYDRCGPYRLEGDSEAKHDEAYAKPAAKQDSVTDPKLRRIILDKYYERRRDGWVSLEPADFGDEIAKSEILRVSQQLHDRSLIEFRSMRGDDQAQVGRGRITGFGVDAVELAPEGGPKGRDDQSPLTVSEQPRGMGPLSASREKATALIVTRQRILLAVSELQQSPSAYVSN
jgi:hypothetical protein